MPLELTNEQELAVNKKGNILVAAAAGSGKTAVLVERVIKKLCSKTDPVRADRLLIVTFTNAAAAEMKSRIEKRLNEECKNNPQDTSLVLQKHLLQNAKICTIDSFCIDFVRENFEKLNISPDFKLSDNNSLKPIDERVLAEVLEPYFREKNPTFYNLLDLVGAEYDEGNFSDFVLSLYEYSCHLPFPDKWFDSLAENYDDGDFKKNNIWRNFAVHKAKQTVEELKKNVAIAVDLISVDEKMSKKFLPIFIFTAEQLDNLQTACESDEWDEIYNSLRLITFPDKPRVSGSDEIPQIKAAKAVYDHIRGKGIEELYKLFYADEAFISAQFKKIYPQIKLLTKILKEFSKRLFETYVEENTFTFHNTEAMALQLLCSEENGVVSINPAASEFLDLFDEVCVDEYQDTNDLQNMLFYVLSNKDSKLFAVGDVKQSIYGFRGANPEYFLEKKNSHISANEANENEPKKIILGNNFRSRHEVCDFINYFFTLFMTEQTGRIVYDNEEKLIPSGKFPEVEYPFVSVDIIETENDIEDKVLESRQIASFIKSTMNSGEMIRADEKTLRKPKYSDFTILLRSVKGNAEIITNELRQQGIPVNFSAEGYCEYAEIAVMLSLLKVVDNPRNDVELLSVMMSALFGFSAEKMSQIRINSPKTDLYSAVVLFAETGDNQTKEFLSTIQKFRLYSVTNTLPQLINIILEETSFLNIVTAYNDGERRRNNLLLLCEYAESYIASYNSGIGGFVDFITKQSESKKIKSASALNGENAVTIMSIHGSKGLQFPICILAFTSGKFNSEWTRANSVHSSKYGLGFRYFDESDKTKYDTIARRAITNKLHEEQLEEELRLLYVAMTRTQDILHITAVSSNIQKKIDDVTNRLICSDSKISSNFWNRTGSYFDWILAALLLHPDGVKLRKNAHNLICGETTSRVKLQIIDGKTVPECCASTMPDEVLVDEELLHKLHQNFEYKYPYEKLSGIQSKASVSVLANKAESEKYTFTSKPSFLSQGGISATERGTAMHKVMEFFNFEKWGNPEEELDRLLEWQFISETERAAINLSALNNFFNSEIFKRMMNSASLHREMRFLTELPAKKIDATLSDEFADEKIIVQGAVDVCFVEEDSVVILDFKTDRTDDPDMLVNAYGEQLNIYAAACEKIFNKPVKEKMIYSFSLGKEIQIK